LPQASPPLLQGEEHEGDEQGDEGQQDQDEQGLEELEAELLGEDGQIVARQNGVRERFSNLMQLRFCHL
jgi:hypothetical protein